MAVAFPSVALAGATASSFHPEHKQGANYWNAQSAIDGRMDTCWMVPGDSKNKGEWIMLDVPKSTLDKLSLVIGWDKDEETFKDYARVKSVEIEGFSYDSDNNLVPKGKATATFEDKRGWQTVDVDDISVGDDLMGGKIKVTVTDVYPGVDYPNLAMSEVLLRLKEFDAAPTIDEVSGEDSDHSKLALVDDNPRTWWAADASNGASITFEASGYSLSRVGIQAGPKTYARPRRIEIDANDRVTTVELKDTSAEQWVEIPAVVGYTGSAWGPITIKVLSTYPGTVKTDEVGIAELNLKATAYSGL